MTTRKQREIQYRAHHPSKRGEEVAARISDATKTLHSRGWKRWEIERLTDGLYFEDCMSALENAVAQTAPPPEPKPDPDFFTCTARSICTCGHTGDGNNSDHATEIIAPGHGACTVPGCKCARFSWARFIKPANRLGG